MPDGVMVGATGHPSYALGDLLAKLGNEIWEAQKRAREDGRPDLFRVKEATVDAITGHVDAHGTLSVAVLELGGAKRKESANTITLTMVPPFDIHAALMIERVEGLAGSTTAPGCAPGAPLRSRGGTDTGRPGAPFASRRCMAACLQWSGPWKREEPVRRLAAPSVEGRSRPALGGLSL